MNQETAKVMGDVNRLVDEYRSRCLWYLRDDFYPTTAAEACRVLEGIAQHGDLSAFRRAATLRQWLLQHSNEPFFT